MCTSLLCQNTKTKVTLARLELAILGLQVVRAMHSLTPPPPHKSPYEHCYYCAYSLVPTDGCARLRLRLRLRRGDCSSEIDKQYHKWAKNKNVRKCPKCNMRVQKDGGTLTTKCCCVFKNFTCKGPKIKLGSVRRADRAQSNGSTKRSLANFHIELEQFRCSLRAA